MIRKIFFGVFLLYLSIWTSVSYFLESKLKENLSQYKDLSIEYSKIKSSGFPNKWEFNIISPIIKSNDQMAIFKTENINVKISINFKKFTLSIGTIANISFAHTDGLEEDAYDIIFNENPRIIIKLKNANFRDNNLMGNLRDVVILPFFMMLSKGDVKLMEIRNNITSINNIKNQDFKLECDIFCDANDDIMAFRKLRINFLLDVDFFDQNHRSVVLSSLDSKTFEIKIDDDSSLDFSGSIDFRKDKIPDGKFILNLYNYNKLVDVLWPKESGFSDFDIKSIIEKCNVNENDGNAYLPIEFSDEGLNIGAETWQALQGE